MGCVGVILKVLCLEFLWHMVVMSVYTPFTHEQSISEHVSMVIVRVRRGICVGGEPFLEMDMALVSLQSVERLKWGKG